MPFGFMPDLAFGFAGIPIRRLPLPHRLEFRPVTVTYASSHSNRRGFHPRIRFAFAFEAPLSFVA